MKLHKSMVSQTKSSVASRSDLKRVPQLFHPQLGAMLAFEVEDNSRIAMAAAIMMTVSSRC